MDIVFVMLIQLMAIINKYLVKLDLVKLDRYIFHVIISAKS
ncbi:hypothetical protein Aazo_3329 ['Nostoc azollae' 0708]|uniref:Uncharacterized protein n=1 Tax=Nostoc azollae (strain 0708) TaxID=551115 RepID=D7E2H6_NOSA0|nr:hypothetical protein Aazo_3329 ['Nostoc azollae' 0708]